MKIDIKENYEKAQAILNNWPIFLYGAAVSAALGGVAYSLNYIPMPATAKALCIKTTLAAIYAFDKELLNEVSKSNEEQPQAQAEELSHADNANHLEHNDYDIFEDSAIMVIGDIMTAY